MNTSSPLEGKRILVTRPREQAGRLAELIRAAGGEAVIFPAIEICDPDDPEALNRLIDRLPEFDLAIFISPTAVQQGLKRVLARRAWPAQLAIAAVGQGSAAALGNYGFRSVIAPTGRADSEALLALPELNQVAGKQVVIFRGKGGREVLAETLRRRGAEVFHAECYRRAKPETPLASLLAGPQPAPLAGVTLTSTESLNNLLDLADPSSRQQLVSIPFFVTHERIALAARLKGIHTLITTAGGDAGLLEAMVKFFQS